MCVCDYKTLIIMCGWRMRQPCVHLPLTLSTPNPVILYNIELCACSRLIWPLIIIETESTVPLECVVHGDIQRGKSQ